jgi:hypothetical protein
MAAGGVRSPALAGVCFREVGAMKTVVDDPDDMMSTVDAAEQGESLAPGMRVEVRSTFDARWARGFEIVSVTESGYRLRRLSDGQELPVDFSSEDVRRERKRQGMWWY